jgi:hypothetical protein
VEVETAKEKDAGIRPGRVRMFLRKRVRLDGPTLVATALLVYSSGTTGIWLLLIGIQTWNGIRNGRGWLWGLRFFQLSDMWPCLILLGLSFLSVVLAFKRKRLAWVFIALVICASVATFWYDVSHHRSQVEVTMCTRDYKGPIHSYFTWWWYSDRWFEYPDPLWPETRDPNASP